MSYIDLGVDIYLDTYMYTEAQEFLKSGPSPDICEREEALSGVNE